MKLDCCALLVSVFVLVSVVSIHFDSYNDNKKKIGKKMLQTRKTKKLYTYLPITTTSLQRPVSSVPKVTVVERCNFSIAAY